MEITVSFLGIHKWELDNYIGFSLALHLQWMAACTYTFRRSKRTRPVQFFKKLKYGSSLKRTSNEKLSHFVQYLIAINIWNLNFINIYWYDTIENDFCSEFGVYASVCFFSNKIVSSVLKTLFIYDWCTVLWFISEVSYYPVRVEAERLKRSQ